MLVLFDTVLFYKLDQRNVVIENYFLLKAALCDRCYSLCYVAV